MPVECPHCKATIEGFVPQEALTKRLSEKDGEIRTLRDAVAEMTPKARDYDAVAGERDGLKAQVAEITQRAERSSALAQRGITDPRLAAAFEAIHASEMAGRPEGERIAFGEIDQWAADHPLLAPHLQPTATGTQPAAPVAGPSGPPAAGAAQAPVGLPRAPGAQPAAPPQGRMTPAQIQAYFRSPEYRALSAADKAAKMTELRSQVSAPNSTTA